MAYEIEGKLILIHDTKTFGSGFEVREFVIETPDDKYPQEIILQFVQDKVSMLDSVSVGDAVSVKFDVRGREHNGRHFNNLQAWHIKSEGATSEAPPADEFEAEEDSIPF